MTRSTARPAAGQIRRRGASVRGRLGDLGDHPSLTSFDTRAFNGKAIREGDYLYSATLPLFSVPLDPSSNGFGRHRGDLCRQGRRAARADRFAGVKIADMLHIDLMRHAETPVPTLKVFKHCWRKAVWHRPSVIAFDNVDKLLGMELEHIKTRDGSGAQAGHGAGSSATGLALADHADGDSSAPELHDIVACAARQLTTRSTTVDPSVGQTTLDIRGRRTCKISRVNRAKSSLIIRDKL
ncbi:hypothetical protein FIBSPDRAFT_892986 [Athelia psychrophila]|uniref:Uncharacterized protein n=1 Tax=Athelia psychrophila TaxID=1759441 RepID=A0A166HT59_9AGAM|nr:hypothetical protein FIBSPDRAFT_892986 [Fibularhizoctonia sp. CBS 109695]